jgi:DNA-binding MarR family transcriptional regulator
MKEWAFITTHGLVLLYVSQNQRCTTRQMASAINITERTVHRVLRDLEDGGYITRQRTGKGNIYQVSHERCLKHELTRDMLVGELISLLGRNRKLRSREEPSKGEE